MEGKKKTCLCSNEGSRREDIVLMIPWWPWEYVQLPRRLWTVECRPWLIVSWYPAFEWLPNLDKTVTVVVLQMLYYMRNINLITRQQLVVCVSPPPRAGSAEGWGFFFSVSAALRQQMVMSPKRDFSSVHLHRSTVKVDAVIICSCSESQ